LLTIHYTSLLFAPDGVGLIEKNLLGWYWDLQRLRDRETDAELYLDAFAAAVSLPVATLKNNLSRADALLRRHGEDHPGEKEKERERERERTWATYYVQLMKEVKTCFVFDQLSHGNDRMKVSKGLVLNHVMQSRNEL
jgi:hypothetical protein